MDNIEFLGSLSESEICTVYLKANIFVSASSIENSSNSIGEAMILGTPVVCSDVGGVKDMVKHRYNGLIYQFDAPYMLAESVLEILNDIDFSKKLSKNAVASARAIHSKADILRNTIRSYSQIHNLYLTTRDNNEH